jgi:hypothetical protein
MLLVERGRPGQEALDRLHAALGDEEITTPDENGVFEVIVAGASFEAALDRVWSALAAAGADDEIVFLEHPEMPEHWRHRARARP